MSQLSSRLQELPLSSACRQLDTALFALLHAAEARPHTAICLTVSSCAVLTVLHNP